MAQRRMFSKKITDTDQFLDMPTSAQVLYFHLNMAADDDGFIGNPKSVRRMVGSTEDDFKLLMAKEFIIPFESGVVVIKDWKIHNYIRSDRYNETNYQEEKQQLTVTKNGSYELGMTHGIPDDIPPVDEMDTQVRLGKDRLGKDRLVLLDDDDDNSQKLKSYSFFENNGFGMLTGNTIEMINSFIEDFMKNGSSEKQADELIIEALKKADENGVRKWNYAKAILNDWYQKGIKNIKELNASEKQRKKNKESEGSSYGGIDF